MNYPMPYTNWQQGFAALGQSASQAVQSVAQAPQINRQYSMLKQKIQNLETAKEEMKADIITRLGIKDPRQIQRIGTKINLINDPGTLMEVGNEFATKWKYYEANQDWIKVKPDIDTKAKDWISLQESVRQRAEQNKLDQAVQGSITRTEELPVEPAQILGPMTGTQEAEGPQQQVTTPETDYGQAMGNYRTAAVEQGLSPQQMIAGQKAIKTMVPQEETVGPLDQAKANKYNAEAYQIVNKLNDPYEKEMRGLKLKEIKNRVRAQNEKFFADDKEAKKIADANLKRTEDKLMEIEKQIDDLMKDMSVTIHPDGRKEIKPTGGKSEGNALRIKELERWRRTFMDRYESYLIDPRQQLTYTEMASQHSTLYPPTASGVMEGSEISPSTSSRQPGGSGGGGYDMNIWKPMAEKAVVTRYGPNHPQQEELVSQVLQMWGVN